MSEEFSFLKRGTESLNLSLSDDVLEKFLYYKQLVTEMNRRLNLTAITDSRKFTELHIIDSLSIFKFISPHSSLIDIGSGAGFPGIILKAALPELELTVLDSHKKKLDFIEEACAKTGLYGVNFVHARAEDAAAVPAYREKFDTAAARAVAALPQLCEYCIPFVRTGGRFIAMKGSAAEKEIADAGGAHALLGCSDPEIFDTELFDSKAQRKILVYRKVRSTPLQYPRKQKFIKNSPLY